MFSSVAGKYDLMNDLMSLGVHRVWKRYFVATARRARGDRVLDLAGGTGDIAALLRERVGAGGEVVLGDINAGMLGVGRDRMTDRGLVRGLSYVQCNAEALPFPDDSFDLVTIAFGLRNVTDKDAALREMRACSRSAARRGCWSSRRCSAEWFKPLYDFHSFQVLPRLGKLFATTPAATSTWPSRSASIRRRRRCKAMMEGGGLRALRYRNLNGRHRRDPYRIQGLRRAHRGAGR